MAVKTFYLTDTAVSTPDFFSIFSESAPASANVVNAWQPAKLAVGSFCKVIAGTSTTASVVSASDLISGTTSPTAGTGITGATMGDSARTNATYTGTFASGNWTFNFGIRPTTGAAQGAIRFRLWRSSNTSGTGATEITSATQECSTVNPSVTTTTVTSTLTFNPGSFAVTNEYLIFQWEWVERVSAGTSSTGKMTFRVGTETSITTTDLSTVAPADLVRRFAKVYLRR